MPATAAPFFSLLPLGEGPGMRVYEQNLFFVVCGGRVAFNDTISIRAFPSWSKKCYLCLRTCVTHVSGTYTQWERANSPQAHIAGEFMPKANFHASPSLT